jgi:predicted acyltransferase
MKYEEISDNNTSIQITESTPSQPMLNKKEKSPKKRILSLDCVRGITICFMIIGNFAQSPKYNWLQHVDWNGWTTLDLVFPVNFKI